MQQAEILKLLGRRIRLIRLQKGLKQEDVAFGADMERAHYTRLELGKSNATTYTLFRISRSLGVEVRDLFEF